MTPHPLQAVQYRRQLAGIGAADVAKMLGITRPSFYRLERGERVCLLPKAITLARLLDCTVEQLGILPTPDEAADIARRRAQREAIGVENNGCVVAQPADHTIVEPGAATSDDEVIDMVRSWSVTESDDTDEQ